MAKKNFNNMSNPALQFMTAPAADQENRATLHTEEDKQLPEFTGLKRGRKPSKEETKTKRLNLLMLPSVCEDVTKIAAMKRSSVNELINTVLQQYIADNQELIEKYDEVFKD